MNLPRRQFLQFASVAAAPAFSCIAWAQTYPTRPITMIVAIAAGGNTDAAARVLAERMRGSLGHPIIIENVTGADGSIGAGRTARARPDGYTIDFGFLGSHVLNGALYSLSYDVLNDFEPISPRERRDRSGRVARAVAASATPMPHTRGRLLSERYLTRETLAHERLVLSLRIGSDTLAGTCAPFP